MPLIKFFSIFFKTFYSMILFLVLPKNQKQLCKKDWACSILKDFGYQLNISGHFETKNEGLILIGNHISFLDILVLMSQNPNIIFIAKKEIKSWPIIGWAATVVGTIFVDRNKHSIKIELQKNIIQSVVEKGAFLVVFPSGTTQLTEELTWKKGIFKIAHKHSISVQSFKISYTPHRESAYIDDDQLFSKILKILSLKNKTASLKWLDRFSINDPLLEPESIRQSVNLA